MQVLATKPEEAYFTLDPFAVLNPSDPWYYHFEKKLNPKHYPMARRLKRLFDPPPNFDLIKFKHIAIVGNKGTGKTTQVRRIMLEDLKPLGIEPAFVDVLSTLDQTDLTFADMVLTIVQTVTETLQKENIQIPKNELELVNQWFSEVLISETHKKELLATVETEANAKFEIPFIANLMAKVTATFKTDNEYRKEIRRRAERDPADLIRRANQLLDAATKAFSKARNKPMTISVILDNLEKIEDRQLVDKAVLRRAEEFRRLRCHIIFFLDPADQYAPVGIEASNAFETVFVPMLHIRHRSDSIDHVEPIVLEAIKELLEKRLSSNQVFENPDACILEIAKMCGGRLRDIFHLAQEACDSTFEAKVKLENVQYAARKLSSIRMPKVKPQQWQRLAEIHRDKQIANSEDDAHLLLHSLVLNYNGEMWFDVHPLVTLDKRFQTAWQTLNQIP